MPTLRLAHSPDPDDAFMWWPLVGIDGAAPPIDTGRFAFETVHDDIESLNVRALEAEYEITAISCAQYPRVRERYALTACGASMGDAYGPKLVAREPMTVAELRGADARIAVPGAHTSAYTATCLLLGRDAFRPETVEFDAIMDAVVGGSFDAGVVIHEGQLTYEAAGLHLVEDLGRWWSRETGLPMPLGGNAIRRDLDDLHGPGTLGEVTALLRASLDHALAERETSIEYAMRFGRGIDADVADEFVRMYVNAWTLDFGDRGREAVRAFLRAAHDAGIVPDPGEVDFVAPLADSTA